MAARQGQKPYAAWNTHSVELVDAATVSPVLHLATYRQGPLSPFTTLTTHIMHTTLYALTTVSILTTHISHTTLSTHTPSTHHSCHTHHSHHSQPTHHSHHTTLTTHTPLTTRSTLTTHTTLTTLTTHTIVQDCRRLQWVRHAIWPCDDGVMVTWHKLCW